MSEEELRERQRADPELKEVIKYLECGQKSEGKLVPVKIALWLRVEQIGVQEWCVI